MKRTRRTMAAAAVACACAGGAEAQNGVRALAMTGLDGDAGPGFGAGVWFVGIRPSPLPTTPGRLLFTAQTRDAAASPGVTYIGAWIHDGAGNRSVLNLDARLAEIGVPPVTFDGFAGGLTFARPGGFGDAAAGLIRFASRWQNEEGLFVESTEWWRAWPDGEIELLLSSETGPVLPGGWIPHPTEGPYDTWSNGSGMVAVLASVRGPDGSEVAGVARFGNGPAEFVLVTGDAVDEGVSILSYASSWAIGLDEAGNAYAGPRLQGAETDRGVLVAPAGERDAIGPVLGNFAMFLGRLPGGGVIGWASGGLYRFAPEGASLLVPAGELAEGGEEPWVRGLVLEGERPVLLLGQHEGDTVIWLRDGEGFAEFVRSGDEVLVDGSPARVRPHSAVLGSDGALLVQSSPSFGVYEILRYERGAFRSVLRRGSVIDTPAGERVVASIGEWWEPVAGDEAVVFLEFWGGGEGLFAVPVSTCLGDFDGDGGVSVEDLLGYLGGFRVGSWEADADGDGQVGVGDLLAFLEAFRAGC